jgi:hypothetical protein
VYDDSGLFFLTCDDGDIANHFEGDGDIVKTMVLRIN